MATVFKLDLNEKYDGHYVLSLKEIFDEFPDLEEIIKPGDIIENNQCCGYRANGSYIYDTHILIELKDEYDDYPCIPVWIFFKYNLPWDHYNDNNLIFNNDFTKDKDCSFYLHSEPTSNAIGRVVLSKLENETLKKIEVESNRFLLTSIIFNEEEEEIRESFTTLNKFYQD